MSYFNKRQSRIALKWLIEQSKRGYLINKCYLLDNAQKIVTKEEREISYTNNRPGEEWFQAFMKKYPYLAQRHAEAICCAPGNRRVHPLMVQ